MREFVYQTRAPRVVFGRGARRRVGEEVERLGRRRALVLCTAGRRTLGEALLEALGERGAGLLDAAVMHTPVAVSERALERAREAGADCTVAVGGGSAIGLGKALALRADLPQIALPTTYAGSEMTGILGQTEGGEKRTLRDERVRPATVIYDAEYTLTLPAALSASSGMNAIAHAVEALYAAERNPVTTLLCLEAIGALATALPRVVERVDDVDARAKALYGAFLCGMALDSASMALHHKLCHTLGGSFDLPHAETHAVILPHATAFNAADPAAGEALAPVATLLGGGAPGAGLWDLARRIGAPTRLADLGLPEEAIERAAELACARPYPNPRPLERGPIAELLRAAHAGERPTG